MVLVLSGTEEGKQIVRRLYEEGISLITTVATEYGKEIFKHLGLEAICMHGRLNMKQLSTLIKEKGVEAVVDATHPFAVEVSRNAVEACRETHTRYLRLERRGVEIPESPLIYKARSMEEAADITRRLGKRIFLSTGISSVEKFIHLLGEKELIVRILPIPEHIALCHGMGIPSRCIIAMHGPFLPDLNRALFRQYKVDTLVTKNSGATGGLLYKIQGAIDEGIDTVIIDRPRMDFPNVFFSVDEVVAALKNPAMWMENKRDCGISCT